MKGIFKTRIIDLPKPPSAVKAGIEALHDQTNQKRHKSKLIWHTWDRFQFHTNAFSPLVKYNGRIQNINHERVRLYIRPQVLKWRLLYSGVITLLFSSSLLLIVILMMETHFLLGIGILLISAWLSWGLYRNLIGQPLKQVRFILERIQMSDSPSE